MSTQSQIGQASTLTCFHHGKFSCSETLSFAPYTVTHFRFVQLENESSPCALLVISTKTTCKGASSDLILTFNMFNTVYIIMQRNNLMT